MLEDLYNNVENVSTSSSVSPCEQFSEATVSRDFCDIDEFEDHASWAVKNFYEHDKCEGYREIAYSDADLELREGYMIDFHNNFNGMSGYSNNLHFSDNLAPNDLGSFDPETKQIVLNSDLLKDSNPMEAMKTIMHETRHAYQDYAINHPEKVSVDADTIKTWKENFKNYISPDFDFEAYCNQPVEKDANDFANRMWNEGERHAA